MGGGGKWGGVGWGGWCARACVRVGVRLCCGVGGGGGAEGLATLSASYLEIKSLHQSSIKSRLWQQFCPQYASTCC